MAFSPADDEIDKFNAWEASKSAPAAIPAKPATDPYPSFDPNASMEQSYQQGMEWQARQPQTAAIPQRREVVDPATLIPQESAPVVQPTSENSALSVSGNLVKGVYQGVTRGIPEMVGGATEFIGEKTGSEGMKSAGKSIKEFNLSPTSFGSMDEQQLAEEKAYRESLTGLDSLMFNIGEMLGPSVIPPAGIARGAGMILGVAGKASKAVAAAERAQKFSKAAVDLAHAADTPERIAMVSQLVAKGERLGNAAKVSIDAAQGAAKATNWIGAGATGTLFGGQQAMSTMEEARRRADELEKSGDLQGAQEMRDRAEGYAPWLTGFFEAVGETLGTKYLGHLLGVDEAVIVKAAAKGWAGVGPKILDILKTMGVEVGTEMFQAASEGATEKYSGIRPEADIWQETKDVIAPTIGLTALTAGIGAGANKLRRTLNPRNVITEDPNKMPIDMTGNANDPQPPPPGPTAIPPAGGTPGVIPPPTGPAVSQPMAPQSAPVPETPEDVAFVVKELKSILNKETDPAKRAAIQSRIDSYNAPEFTPEEAKAWEERQKQIRAEAQAQLKAKKPFEPVSVETGKKAGEVAVVSKKEAAAGEPEQPRGGGSRSGKTELANMVVGPEGIVHAPMVSKLGTQSSDLQTGAPSSFVAEGKTSSAVLGNKGTIEMAPGKSAEFTWGIGEAGDVGASDTVVRNAKGEVALEPSKPGDQAERAITHGRTAGVQGLYNFGTPENVAKYREMLSSPQSVAVHGISPEQIASMKQPMLRRIFSETVAKEHKMATTSNVKVSDDYAAVEQARLDAGNVSPEIVGALEGWSGNPQDIPDGVMREFQRYVPNTELNAYKSEKGGYTPEARDRVRNAVMAYATLGEKSKFNPNSALSMLSDTQATGAVRAVQGIVAASPALAKLKTDIKTGKLDAKYDISDALNASLEKIVDLRNRGMNIDRYVRQGSFFKEEFHNTPNAMAMLKAMAARSASSKDVADMLDRYAQWAGTVESATDENGNPVDLFGTESKIVTPGDFFRNEEKVALREKKTGKVARKELKKAKGAKEEGVSELKKRDAMTVPMFEPDQNAGAVIPAEPGKPFIKLEELKQKAAKKKEAAQAALPMGPLPPSVKPAPKLKDNTVAGQADLFKKEEPAVQQEDLFAKMAEEKPSEMRRIQIGNADLRLMENPSKEDLKSLVGAQSIRGLLDRDSGTLYVWNAYDATHADVIDALGIKNSYRYWFSPETDRRGVNTPEEVYKIYNSKPMKQARNRDRLKNKSNANDERNYKGLEEGVSRLDLPKSKEPAVTFEEHLRRKKERGEVLSKEDEILAKVQYRQEQKLKAQAAEPEIMAARGENLTKKMKLREKGGQLPLPIKEGVDALKKRVEKAKEAENALEEIATIAVKVTKRQQAIDKKLADHGANKIIEFGPVVDVFDESKRGEEGVSELARKHSNSKAYALKHNIDMFKKTDPTINNEPVTVVHPQAQDRFPETAPFRYTLRQLKMGDVNAPKYINDINEIVARLGISDVVNISDDEGAKKQHPDIKRIKNQFTKSQVQAWSLSHGVNPEGNVNSMVKRVIRSNNARMEIKRLSGLHGDADSWQGAGVTMEYVDKLISDAGGHRAFARTLNLGVRKSNVFKPWPSMTPSEREAYRATEEASKELDSTFKEKAEELIRWAAVMDDRSFDNLAKIVHMESILDAAWSGIKISKANALMYAPLFVKEIGRNPLFKKTLIETLGLGDVVRTEEEREKVFQDMAKYVESMPRVDADSLTEIKTPYDIANKKISDADRMREVLRRTVRADQVNVFGPFKKDAVGKIYVYKPAPLTKEGRVPTEQKDVAKAPMFVDTESNIHPALVALNDIVGTDAFRRLTDAGGVIIRDGRVTLPVGTKQNREELLSIIRREYPRFRDAGMETTENILQAYGAIKSKEFGYDAIVTVNPRKDATNRMMSLDKENIDRVAGEKVVALSNPILFNKMAFDMDAADIAKAAALKRSAIMAERPGAPKQSTPMMTKSLLAEGWTPDQIVERQKTIDEQADREISILLDRKAIQEAQDAEEVGRPDLVAARKAREKSASELEFSKPGFEAPQAPKQKGMPLGAEAEWNPELAASLEKDNTITPKAVTANDKAEFMATSGETEEAKGLGSAATYQKSAEIQSQESTADRESRLSIVRGKLEKAITRVESQTAKTPEEKQAQSDAIEQLRDMIEHMMLAKKRSVEEGVSELAKRVAPKTQMDLFVDHLVAGIIANKNKLDTLQSAVQVFEAGDEVYSKSMKKGYKLTDLVARVKNWFSNPTMDIIIEAIGFTPKQILEEQGYYSMIGAPAATIEQVRQAAEIVRDATHERGATIIVRNGRIIAVAVSDIGLVDQEGKYWSDGSRSLDRHLNWIADMVSKYSADSVYRIHNHPTGNVVASQADITGHDRLAESLGGLYKGEVITNRNQYTHLSDNGSSTYSISDDKIGINPENPIDYTTHSIGSPMFESNPMLRENSPKSLTYKGDMARKDYSHGFMFGNTIKEWMGFTHQPKDYATVIYLNSYMVPRFVEHIHNRHFEDATGIQHIQNRAFETGSPHPVIYFSESGMSIQGKSAIAKEMYNTFFDVMSDENTMTMHQSNLQQEAKFNNSDSVHRLMVQRYERTDPISAHIRDAYDEQGPMNNKKTPYQNVVLEEPGSVPAQQGSTMTGRPGIGLDETLQRSVELRTRGFAKVHNAVVIRPDLAPSMNAEEGMSGLALRADGEDGSNIFNRFEKMFKKLKDIPGHDDMGKAEGLYSIPWWLAKKYKEFQRAIGIEMDRSEKRSDIIHKVLFSSTDVLGKAKKHAFIELKEDDAKDLFKVMLASDSDNKYYDKDGNTGELQAAARKALGKELTKEQVNAYHEWKRSMDRSLEYMYNTAHKLNLLPYDTQPWRAQLEVVTGKDPLEVADSRDATAKTLPKDQRAEFKSAVNSVMMYNNQLRALRQSIGKMEYYVPRVRRGEWAVRVKDKDGNVVYHDRAESAHEIASIKEEIIEHQKESGEWAGMEIATSHEPGFSEDVYQMLSDAAIQRFINSAMESAKARRNVPPDYIKAVQEAVMDSITSSLKQRAFGQRLMRRLRGDAIRGYAGSKVGKENIQPKKILFDYVTGMAGFTTKQEAAFQYAHLMRQIPKATPELYDAISKYAKDMLRNQGVMDKYSSKARNAAFTYYIAGRLSAALVQATQNFVTGIPVLGERIGSISRAHSVYGKAYADVYATGSLTPEEKSVLQEAVSKGIAMDQEIQNMRGEVSHMFEGALGKTVGMLAKPFSWMEIKNREAAFLAMYREAKTKYLKMNMTNDNARTAAFADAKAFVYDTHYLLGKMNLPAWARGGDAAAVIMKTLYTFKSFPHNFILSLIDMNRKKDGKVNIEGMKATMMSMAYLSVFAGMAGLPFLDDILEQLEKMFGFPARAKIKKTLNGIGGKYLEAFGSKGIPAVIGEALPGGGFDISGSLKIGLPTLSPDSIFGVWEGAMGKAKKAYEAIGDKEYLRAIESASPLMIENAMKAIRSSRTGATTPTGKVMFDDKGMPIKFSGPEALMQGMGFRPSRTAAISDEHREFGNITEYYKGQRENIETRFRIAAASGSGMSEVLKDVQAYNRAALKHKGGITPITAQALRNSTRQRPNKREIMYDRAMEAE